MTFPRNEAETIALYEIIQNRIGWRIVESQSNAFPDAILESDDGERLACEFEHLAKNFKKHGHPVDDSCDLIICWRDDWPEAPLPVMALEGCAKEEAKIIRGLLKGKVEWLDLHFANLRVSELEEKLEGQKSQLQTIPNTQPTPLDDDYYDNRLEEMLSEYREKCERIAREYGLLTEEVDKAIEDDIEPEAVILGVVFLTGLGLAILYGLWELFKWFMLDLKGFLILLFS